MKYIAITALIMLLTGMATVASSHESRKDEKGDPCSADFAWHTISSDEEAQQHLLTLAQCLKTPERMAQWFRDKGFSVSEYPATAGEWYYVYALWETKKIGARPPFAQNLWLWPHLVTRGKDYDVQVRYEDGNPIKVTAGYIIL